MSIYVAILSLTDSQRRLVVSLPVMADHHLSRWIATFLGFTMLLSSLHGSAGMQRRLLISLSTTVNLSPDTSNPNAPPGSHGSEIQCCLCSFEAELTAIMADCKACECISYHRKQLVFHAPCSDTVGHHCLSCYTVQHLLLQDQSLEIICRGPLNHIFWCNTLDWWVWVIWLIPSCANFQLLYGIKYCFVISMSVCVCVCPWLYSCPHEFLNASCDMCKPHQVCFTY